MDRTAGINIRIRKMARSILALRSIKIFARKHPRTYKIVLSRFTIKNFSGLPLTFLIAVLSMNLLLVFNFTNDVVNSKEFIIIDTLIAKSLFAYRNDTVAKLLYAVTKLGSTSIVAVSGSILFIILQFKKYTAQAIAICMSMIGSGITIYISKSIFEVNRPHHFAYYVESSFSFPSGHTTIAVAFYGLIFYLLIRKINSAKARHAVFICGVLLISLIGFSRLYLCVHYLSDVIGGYLIGSLWMFLAISFFEWMEFRKKAALRYHV